MRSLRAQFLPHRRPRVPASPPTAHRVDEEAPRRREAEHPVKDTHVGRVPLREARAGAADDVGAREDGVLQRDRRRVGTGRESRGRRMSRPVGTQVSGTRSRRARWPRTSSTDGAGGRANRGAAACARPPLKPWLSSPRPLATYHLASGILKLPLTTYVVARSYPEQGSEYDGEMNGMSKAGGRQRAASPGTRTR